jgi:hypothetical protein
VYALIRYYFKRYHDITDIDFAGKRNTLFYGVINIEFGLLYNEAEILTIDQIHTLLRFDHRLRTAGTEVDRQRVLTEVARLREDLTAYPDLPDTDRSFLKALRYKKKFPDPESRLPAKPRANGAKEAPSEWTELETDDDRAVTKLHRWLSDGRKIKMTSLAKAIGVPRQQMYNKKRFPHFWALLETHKRDLPTGERGENGDLEAWDDA